MDRLHKPNKKPFISSLVSVRAFREKAEESIGELPRCYFENANEVATLVNCLGYSENEAAEVLSNFNPSELRCDKDLKAKSRLELPKVPILESHRSILKEKAGEDDPYSSPLLDFMERRIDYDLLGSCKRIAARSKIKKENRLKNEAVLTVVLAKPYDTFASSGEITRKHGVRIDRVLLVLSSQKLTELRDFIFCPNDFAPIRERQEDDEFKDVVAKDVFTGSLFYFNGVFYNDLREKKSTDLSVPILKWAEGRLGSVGPFSTARMEETTFDDLNIRLGQPYVYIHQGNCEHLVVISNIHFAHEEDPQDVSWYPIDFTRRAKTIVHCDICQDSYAKWIVFAKDHLPQPTMFFCKSCFDLFCTDENGKSTFELVLVPLIDSNYC
ncbi:hypothetical protein M514_00594, partial [Trichuris suis]|uniref:snRNA-activating protein complex subunit 3 n=1 Tax=Trichuris suis TaxID=68888 RepID=A0A085MMC2_9BILA